MRAPFLQSSLRQRLPTLRPGLRQRRYNSELASKSESGATNETSQKASQAADKSQPTATPVSIWRRLGPLTSAFDAFARSQKKRPYTTQIISAMVIFTCADVSAQNIAQSDYDPVRTARAILIGGVAAIPQYRWWVYADTDCKAATHADNSPLGSTYWQDTSTTLLVCYLSGQRCCSINLPLLSGSRSTSLAPKPY